MARERRELGQVHDEEKPAIRVIVLADSNGRAFDDDPDPGDVVFDSSLTPMLVYRDSYPALGGRRSGWVLHYDTDGQGNPDDWFIGFEVTGVDLVIGVARAHLRKIGYPDDGWGAAADNRTPE